jgi:formate hydrogenlyase subunit 3/multisubunit Na+/H+ antiporter MnhD subunit
MPELGKTLIVLGIAIVVLGVLFTFGGRIPWLGNLPGDIHIQRGRFSFYFPITTCIVISAVISLVLYFYRR